MDKFNRNSSGDQYPKQKVNGSYNNHRAPPGRVVQGWMNGRPNQRPASYWQPQGQKLLPAMSDPAVCGYSVPFGYPFDQVALPVYPMIPATPVPRPFNTMMSYPDVRQTQKRGESFTNYNQRETQYTSLPPGNGPDCGSDQRRRFSDPGLANTQSDDSNSSTTTDNDLLNEQMSNLMKENEKLKKDITLNREEINGLKLEMNLLFETQDSYSPGAVTEIVKEVESGISMREEAITRKTQQIVKDILTSMGIKKINKQTEEEGPTKQEFEELKNKLNEVTMDRDILRKRIIDLEESVDNFIRESRSKETKQSSRLLSLEQEELKLTKQLQESIEAQKLGNAIRSKSVFGKISSYTFDDKEKCDINNLMSSLETSESLSSSIGSSSHHSPLVTMSGPVTDV